MKNTRALTNPSPVDANLRTGTDCLGMLRRGENDLSRYLMFKTPRPKINNGTGDPFNHTLSEGGYNSDGWTISGRRITAVAPGGIIPLPPPPSQQNSGNQMAPNPYPLRSYPISALCDYPVVPRVSELVDEPIPPNIKPLVLPVR